jgi:hypothetical protein
VDTLTPAAATPAVALLQQGQQLDGHGEAAQALACYDEALALQPDLTPGHILRGLALRQLQRPEDALQSFERAIALAPNDYRIYSERGNTLRELGRRDEALASFDRALALEPRFAMGLNNRAALLGELVLPHAALESLLQAVAIEPDNPDPHWNIALCTLLMGDYARGWREYEWRWKNTSLGSKLRECGVPRWTGEPLDGRRVLLHAEQGFGDTLQFCRYAPMLQRQGAHVVLEVQPALAGLLRGQWAGIEVIARGDALPPLDCHCPLLSVPDAVGTRVDTIPSPGPYLRPPADSLAKWRRRLPDAGAPRVGIVWSGNPKHKNDHNRSLPLATLLEALPSGPRYYSLQRELRPGEGALLASRPDVTHLGGDLDDYRDTAAACTLMDWVICVDTSVAHLAAALGRPTWVLLPAHPDWRWLLDRTDSPWYGSARLWRQPSLGDWASLLRSVRRGIEDQVWKQQQEQGASCSE